MTQKEQIHKVLSNKLCPLKDYLIKPFNNLIDKLSKKPVFNKGYLMVGMTGQGKTTSITTNALRKLLIGEDLQVVIYSAPENAILENAVFEEATMELQKDLPKGVHVKFCDNPMEALKAIKSGKKVVISTTHAGIWTKQSKFGPILFNHIYDNKISNAVFIDEAHMWTISDWINYKPVSGNEPTNYEASLFTKVQMLSEFSPFIFFITATPNREHNGIVTPIGTMEYEIINDFPPKKLMVWKNAWLNSHTHFDANSEVSIKETMKKMFSKMKEDEKKTGVKKVAIIQVKPVLSQKVIDGRIRKGMSTWHADLKTIKQMAFDLNNAYEFWSPKELVFSEMNEKNVSQYSSDGNYVQPFQDSQELKETSNDVNDELRVIFVVEKGKAGMNIFPAKVLMSLKNYTAKSDDLGFITEIPLQIMGRLVRLYAGMSKDELVAIAGGDYNMKKFLSNTTIKLEVMKILNSFDLYIPNTKVWYKAIEEFLEKYATHIDDVNFDEFELGTDGDTNPLCEQDDCTRCGGTGKEPKTDIVEDTNYDGLDNVFELKG